jgi:lactate dehydrogenase-like 2-hydroxyacid dehydrogenase
MQVSTYYGHTATCGVGSTTSRSRINELYERIEHADAVLTLLTTKVDRAFLDAAGPQLKVVSNVAVGYNNIDVAACRDRGVIATNTPGVLTDATADIAMALILMVTRRLGEGERNRPFEQAVAVGNVHAPGHQPARTSPGHRGNGRYRSSARPTRHGVRNDGRVQQSHRSQPGRSKPSSVQID